MRKTVLITMVVLMLSALALTACGGGADAVVEGEGGSYQIPTIEDGKYNVAFVYVGPHDDGPIDR